MRVIKSGNTKKPKEVKATCTTCTCKFAFVEKEAKFVLDRRDGNYFTINCPECKTPVAVDASLV